MAYHLVIAGPGAVAGGMSAGVLLLGVWRDGDRSATVAQSFTLREHDAFQGRTLIPYYHGRMRTQLLALTGHNPLLTRVTIRGDQGWMNEADRMIIAAYRLEVDISVDLELLMDAKTTLSY